MDGPAVDLSDIVPGRAHAVQWHMQAASGSESAFDATSTVLAPVWPSVTATRFIVEASHCRVVNAVAEVDLVGD